MLLPFIIFKKQHRYTGKNVIPLLIYGLVSVALTVCQFAPLLLGVPVAIAVLLLYTQPLWTLLFSWIILKEKIKTFQMISCLVVLAGVIILVNPFQPLGHIPIFGVIVGLIGGMLLSGWIMAGSYLSKKGNDPINSLFTEKFFCIVIYMALLPLFSRLIGNETIVHFSLDWPLRVWIGLILFSLIVQILNHWFYLAGTKKVPTVDAGIIMLLEPVVGAILAAVFLHQPITLGIIFGGAFILIANYFTIRQETKLIE